MNTIDSFGLFPDNNKPAAVKLSDEVYKWLTDAELDVIALYNDFSNLSELRGNSAVIIFGGDGLILFVANKLAELDCEIPMIRVNFGTIGFLTNIEPTNNEIFARLIDVSNGKYIITRRTRIAYKVALDPGMVDGLNEIVIERDQTKSISFQLCYGKEHKWGEEYKITGDGILFATMTGSTAYNRSIGGPILLNDKIVATPIAPSNLEAPRAIVRNTDDVFIVSNIVGKARLVVDGNECCTINDTSLRSTIVIGKSPRSTYFMEFGYL